MPIYEFDCRSCGSEFDKLVRSMAAVSEVTCPSCDSANVKKRLSLFSSRLGGNLSTSTGTSTASCSPGGL